MFTSWKKWAILIIAAFIATCVVSCSCTTRAPFILSVTVPSPITIPESVVVTAAGGPGSSRGLFTWTFSTNCGGTFTTSFTPNNGPANPITIGPTNATTVQLTYSSVGATPGPCVFTVKLVTASGRTATATAITTIVVRMFSLTVTKAGTGSGTVTSNPAGINCGTDCAEDYAEGTVVTLTATPDQGSAFEGWSGDADCSDGQVTMDAAKSCTATFNPQQFNLRITGAGSGNGRVTADGINCVIMAGTPSGDCSEVYTYGTQVSLAVADVDSAFAGWSGACSGMDSPTTITMDADKECTATFSHPFLLAWGSRGSAPGQFYSPTGIAVDSAGNVYVADRLNDRIQKFDNNGNFLLAWDSWGPGYMNHLVGPWGVEVGSAGNVYVTEGFDHCRVVKFDSNGNFLLLWGGFGGGPGKFNEAYDVAVDSAGNVYVADTEDHNIEKFDSNGNFLLAWGTEGSPGSGPGQFDGPWGIAVDNAGNVYVADQLNHRIQKFDSEGNFLLMWGSYGSGPGQFKQPTGIAVDNAGNVYVADRLNHRIQKFGPP